MQSPPNKTMSRLGTLTKLIFISESQFACEDWRVHPAVQKEQSATTLTKSLTSQTIDLRTVGVNTTNVKDLCVRAWYKEVERVCVLREQHTRKILQIQYMCSKHTHIYPELATNLLICIEIVKQKLKPQLISTLSHNINWPQVAALCNKIHSKVR